MANKSHINYLSLMAINQINEAIEKKMKEKKIGFKELERFSGVRRTTLYRIMTGVPANFGTYIKILDALGYNEITLKWRE